MAPMLSKQSTRPTHISRPSLSGQGSSQPFSPSGATTASSQGGYSYSQYGGYGQSPVGSTMNTSQAPPPSQQLVGNNGAMGPPGQGQHQRKISSSGGKFQGLNISGPTQLAGSTAGPNASRGPAGADASATLSAQEKMEQTKEVARVHFRALRSFLWTWLENGKSDDVGVFCR